MTGPNNGTGGFQQYFGFFSLAGILDGAYDLGALTSYATVNASQISQAGHGERSERHCGR